MQPAAQINFGGPERFGIPTVIKKSTTALFVLDHIEKNHSVSLPPPSFLKSLPCSPAYPQGCWNYHLLCLTFIVFHLLFESHLQVSTSLSKLPLFTLHGHRPSLSPPPVPAPSLDLCAVLAAEVKKCTSVLFSENIQISYSGYYHAKAWGYRQHRNTWE